MTQTFDFHGTKMIIIASTSETNGSHTILQAIHPPNVGPALHMHPKGPETFQIIQGEYRFLIGDKNIEAKKYDIITVPKGVPHKFSSGSNGGQFLVTSPPDLENYFYEVSQLLLKGNVSWDIESAIAKKYGQVFLQNTNHWESI
jgi:mannose-6-phosphate isomerase-like protein (cupin superfamily)